MGTQLRPPSCPIHHHHHRSTGSRPTTTTPSFWHSSSLSVLSSRFSGPSKDRRNRGFVSDTLLGLGFVNEKERIRISTRRRKNGVVLASAGNVVWENKKPDKASSNPSLSDILWPSAGAFAAMAILGKVDQILSPKGVSVTIAPLGAVCAVLFTAPSSPAARKYNMFMAQIGCAAIGVLAFSLFGPGWLARSAALAASIAFMILTRATHPPAASLPILFIDGVKLHHLNFWYALFPGAAGCLILCLIQEIISYLKDNLKF